MVNVGFIVEGDSEKILVESKNFRTFLKSKGFNLISPVVNAGGGGNLLPQNIEFFVRTLEQKGVDLILVLTDLEDEESVDAVRNRVKTSYIDHIFIAVKALEAWFLASDQAMRKALGDQTFTEQKPEETEDKPWERLKELLLEHTGRGPGNKPKFAKKITSKYNYCIRDSGEHPNCPSARAMIEYFEKTKL